MGTDLVNLGQGTIPYNYFYLSLVASLGILQMVAARYNRQNLLWFSATYSFCLGALLLVGAFVWFFSYEPEISIPGLAGGELTLLFGAAFMIAVAATRGGSALRARFHPNLRPFGKTLLAKLIAESRDPASDL